MTDRIRLAAWLPYPQGTAPSQRFRIEQWIPELRATGIDVDIQPFATEGLMTVLHRPGRAGAKAVGLGAACARRLIEAHRSKGYDAVVVHRAACLAGPPIAERWIARRGMPLIYDFDDAIFHLHTTAANRWAGRLKFPKKTEVICRLSAHVTVGNTFLAEHALRWNPAVTIIPSSVDIDCIRPRHAGPSSDPVVVGWTGSSTSLTHLEGAIDIVRALAAIPGVRLRVHCDREPRIAGIPFEFRLWRAETEATEIAAFDIGIMPMPDDPWARGKGAMKALLYMAVGIPVVLSPVGTNLEVVQDHRNGRFARTAEEWKSAVAELARDPAARARMGAEGRRRVEEGYSRARSAAAFAAVVREVVHQHRPAVAVESR